MLHMCVHHEKELTRGGTRRGTCALGFFFWTRLRCRLDVGSVSFPLIWDHSERRACSRNSWSKLPCPGGHRADLAACPLHGDSSGFNYPQLRFIFFQLGYALCPSILCESLSHRYQGELQRRVCARGSVRTTTVTCTRDTHRDHTKERCMPPFEFRPRSRHQNQLQNLIVVQMHCLPLYTIVLFP